MRRHQKATTNQSPQEMYKNPMSAGTKSNLGSRHKLMKSAEILFSTKGFREVSVREIAANAGVNPALVGYYFGGKRELFNEIYRSHAVPLSREQRKMLKAITEANRIPTVEEVVRAYLSPWLQIVTDPQSGSLRVPAIMHLFEERYKNAKRISILMRRVHSAFIDVLHQCLPNLSKETLTWRLHFIVGATNFGFPNPGPLRALSKGKCDPMDLEMLLAQIIPFAVSALNAPEPDVPRKIRKTKSRSRA
jgi:AcrR family transcriptional regulator